MDWYPWGPEALQKATELDMPILVSIGYSACHWCHVMERESFEDPQVAEYMNAHFINIKIDREERPDLDHIYMDALQAMSGSGGWPLNVFLTPAGRPFYGGTYFPPKRAFNRASWMEVLQSIKGAYAGRRRDIDAQAQNLVDHLKANNDLARRASPTAPGFSPERLSEIRDKIMQSADRELGGFGHAPKFPQTFLLQYLLRDYHIGGAESACRQVCLSLDKMIQGGIYDQIGGGFARYSTDSNWLLPHFEKMLYDNALLVTLISEAYQLTGRPQYRQAIEETMTFVQREMQDRGGGFYAALDADSEGREGEFYIWHKNDIDSLLGGETELFCAYYGVSAEGNWEGSNILQIPTPAAEFAKENGVDLADLQARLASCRQILLQARGRRTRPGLDDKVLLGWNALMITASCKAYAALGTESYRQLAISAMDYILRFTRAAEGEAALYYHSLQKGVAKIGAFLDDYAFLVAALIDLQEVSGDTNYLLKAKEICEWLIIHFGEQDGPYFYFTHSSQRDLILRKLEIYDGATPSGNAVMASNLHYLSIVFNRPEWKERAVAACTGIAALIEAHPGSFALWATVVQALTYGLYEVVIIEKPQAGKSKAFLQHFIPFRVFQSATSQNDSFPLLRQKAGGERPLIYLCRDYSCQTPVHEIDEIIPLLETVQKF